MIPLRWLKIKSGKISKIKVRPNVHDLRGNVMVEFNEGKVYNYKDVPLIKVERMLDSNDPYGYFVGNIRGVHDHERVQVKKGDAE